MIFLRGAMAQPPPKNIIDFFEKIDPQTKFINESGFYTLIFGSKKPEAESFKHWVTSEVLPSIRKTGRFNIIDNYIEEDLEKYYNKDCVYIINIKDDIYKYGRTSNIFKRLQAHKTNLKYKKVIKIYELNNINNSEKLEKKIKQLVKDLNINITYNNHIEIFQIDNNNLYNIIEKIDELSLKINKINNSNQIKENNDKLILELKNKELELKNKELELKNKEIELLKLQKNI